MNDELIAAAELGEEARNFLKSDLGRLILGFAQQETDMAKEKLLTVDPQDTDAIRGLQRQADFAAKFEQWLLGIIQDGEQSMAAFKQQQQT